MAHFPSKVPKIMHITQAPNGINVVVETDDTVYIGRLGKLDGEHVNMHHASVFQVKDQRDSEQWIRHTARYGVEVEHEALLLDTRFIQRIRKLGDVPKA